MAPTRHSRKPAAKKSAVRKPPAPKRPSKSLRHAIKPQPNRRSLNNLPGEVRNAIFSFPAAELRTVIIRDRGQANTTGSHALTLASHLMHRDFNGVVGEIAPVTANKVIAKVVDMNFGPLILFLRRVVDSKYAEISDFHQGPGGRVLRIDMSFTDAVWRSPPTVEIAQFFRFAMEPGHSFLPTFHVEHVANAAKTKDMLESSGGGHAASVPWVLVVTAFRDWEARQRPAVVQVPPRNQSLRERLGEKSLLQRVRERAMERRADDEYAEAFAAEGRAFADYRVEAYYAVENAMAQEEQDDAWVGDDDDEDAEDQVKIETEER